MRQQEVDIIQFKHIKNAFKHLHDTSDIKIWILQQRPCTMQTLFDQDIT